MQRSWFLPAFLLLASAAAPALAVVEPSAEDLQGNRRKLQQWKADPDHYARLKRDYRAFMELPADKRDRMRELDRDLREEDLTTRERLDRVLERYSAWLDRLTEENKSRVEAASDSAERLRIVKGLREEEWINRLADVDQKRIKRASADHRAKVISDIRAEERDRRREWQAAVFHFEEPGDRAGKPVIITDFPWETQLYVNRTLKPMLSREEARRLFEAQGKWPDYARTLLQLSQNHRTVRFPPGKDAPPVGPADYKPGDIPQEILNLALPRKMKDGSISKADIVYVKRLQEARGKWPDFGLAVREVAKEKKVALNKPLGPCTLEEMHPAVQQFYKNKFESELKNHKDYERLNKASGTWPDYPMLFMELAQEYNLKVPGTFLGGQADVWKNANAEK